MLIYSNVISDLRLDMDYARYLLTRACLQTHHGPAPLLDPALSESRVRATLQTRPSIRMFSRWLLMAGCGPWPIRKSESSIVSKRESGALLSSPLSASLSPLALSM